MKPFINALLMIALFVSACSKSGDQGPKGDPGNANVSVFEKDISTATWITSGTMAAGYLYLDIAAPNVLTAKALEENTILVYVYTSDFSGWGIVPYMTERNIRVTAMVNTGVVRIIKEQNGKPSTQSWHNKIRVVLVKNAGAPGALNLIKERGIGAGTSHIGSLQ
ncbi:hypothetical protein HHL16_19620 [Pseudoflavitalea sp. G-6-1-2]|uniref:hypothetical protein n=1 Tax=Pseudoflavitalea sp. G-6-1-2 TaxID=2728841 RepID=UPI00146F9104|nr:hypothetical protein [Pseudoflavitalea sp. G-6-1-2]NML23097.1 hypothetical protein [Pseudoflavitalea sp. G-6-1-2]